MLLWELKHKSCLAEKETGQPAHPPPGGAGLAGPVAAAAASPAPDPKIINRTIIFEQLVLRSPNKL
jgi:hypothetical protein